MRAPLRTFVRARALRRQMSLPEVVLWQALRQKRLAGLRIRRQHPVGSYILDFYCPAARLAIEVDGFAHDTTIGARHDERRRAWLLERGITVLRVRAEDVLHDESLEGVLLEIENAARFEITPSGALCAPPPPLPRGRNPHAVVVNNLNDASKLGSAGSVSDAEAPYEMVNLLPRMTGLPMTIWASPRGQARHDVRIKVNPTHGRQMVICDAVSVTVRPVARVVAGPLSPADRQAVLRWIALNDQALADYWEFRIDTDEFLQRLKPLSPPIPP